MMRLFGANHIPKGSKVRIPDFFFLEHITMFFAMTFFTLAFMLTFVICTIITLFFSASIYDGSAADISWDNVISALIIAVILMLAYLFFLTLSKVLSKRKVTDEQYYWLRDRHVFLQMPAPVRSMSKQVIVEYVEKINAIINPKIAEIQNNCKAQIDDLVKKYE